MEVEICKDLQARLDSHSAGDTRFGFDVFPGWNAGVLELRQRLLRPQVLEGTMTGSLSVLALLLGAVLLGAVVTAQGQSLPQTQTLTTQGDLAAQMVAGLDVFFTRETGQLAAQRERRWRRDFSSPAGYVRSIEPPEITQALLQVRCLLLTVALFCG